MRRIEELFAWMGEKGCLDVSLDFSEPHEKQERPEQILQLDTSRLDGILTKHSRENGSSIDLSPQLIDEFLKHSEEDLDIPSEFEVLAWYQPIHFYGENWGIFYKEEAIVRIAKNVFARINLKFTTLSPEMLIHQSIFAAIQILYLHEVYHHQVEAFAIRNHLVTNRCSYETYSNNVFWGTRNATPHLCREEALCHANALRKINQALSGKLSKEVSSSAKLTTLQIINTGVGPYAGAGFLTSEPDFTIAESHLKSQIQEGIVTPAGETTRWKLENKLLSPLFLKIPQFVVPQATPQVHLPGVMHLTAPRRGVVKLLSDQGYREVSGGKGSHTKYEKPGSPMVIIPKGKELSQKVLSDTAKSLGMKMHDFAKLARIAA